MSDDEDVNDLRAKLQQQAAEFQSYKQECRNIEAMLQQDCQKKDDQIRQLKEDSIKRQKGQRMLKTQVSQLQAEVANLKTQLAQSSKSSSSSTNQKQQLDKLNMEVSQLKEQNLLLEEKLQAYNTKVMQYEMQLNESLAKREHLERLLEEAENRPPTIITAPSSKEYSHDPKLQQQNKKLKQKLSILQKQKSKYQKLCKQRESQIDKLRTDFAERMKKMNQSRGSLRQQKPAKRQISEPKQTVPLAEHKLQLAKQKQMVHQLQEKLEGVEKEYKQKINGLVSEKQNLQKKNKGLQKQLQRQRQRRQQISSIESPLKQHAHNDQPFIEQNPTTGNTYHHMHQLQQNPSMRTDCLLLTKRHYLSPFIQIKEGKLIKMYKSTKNGYQKSLGATKHKFDTVGYDAEAIVHNGTTFAKDSIERGTSHTILLYGSKRTSKKYLMAALVRSLKDWIIQRLSPHTQQYQSDYQPSSSAIHCTYMKRSTDQQKNYLHQSHGDKQQIEQILQEIIGMGQPSSPSKIKSKKNSKPKVRYFAITFEEGLTLEIITTSYLNPFIKNNQTFTDYVNTIVFNKLPNILQSAITNFHIITTINPIVNLYEQCKNTLSITLVPVKDNATTAHETTQQQMESRFVFNNSQGINKEDLNQSTKKKVQNFQKETELASLKARKIEDECNYFRERLEELEIRLKGLINTSQQQNTYLKKSPVTLSYEKLLKFIKAVLARNAGQTKSGVQQHVGQTSTGEEYQNQLEMYIQEDAKSLDGY